jgi:hypothetical protein
MKHIILISALLFTGIATATDSTASYHLKRAAVNRGCAIGAAAIGVIITMTATTKEELIPAYFVMGSALCFEIASISHTYRAGRSLDIACGSKSVGIRFSF